MREELENLKLAVEKGKKKKKAKKKKKKARVPDLRPLMTDRKRL